MHFDEGFGGLGLNPKLQRLVNERVAPAGGPIAMARNPIGYGMCGPTVHAWGSDEQKQRYLRPLFTVRGDLVPAVLRARFRVGLRRAVVAGVRDGDEWIVNGQKVWTTLAHVSKWGLLVVRTDPRPSSTPV